MARDNEVFSISGQWNTEKADECPSLSICLDSFCIGGVDD
jgi:hypothetical protein